jgi:hypothetical protein
MKHTSLIHLRFLLLLRIVMTIISFYFLHNTIYFKNSNDSAIGYDTFQRTRAGFLFFVPTVRSGFRTFDVVGISNVSPSNCSIHSEILQSQSMLQRSVLAFTLYIAYFAGEKRPISYSCVFS